EAEQQYGDLPEAVAIYNRVLESAPDAEIPEGQRHALALRTARLLEELGRPAEAVASLAAVLAVSPPIRTAHEMARRMLGDPASGAAVAAQLERTANDAEHGAASRLFAFLVEARQETAAMPEARRRWARCVVELSTGVPEIGLSAIVQAALDFPDEIP